MVFPVVAEDTAAAGAEEMSEGIPSTSGDMAEQAQTSADVAGESAPALEEVQHPDPVEAAASSVTAVSSSPEETVGKEGYITVNPTPSASNIVVFGNTSAITHWPTGLNYRDVGGSSAIRRDGSMDMFVPGPSLPADKTWVAVTNGAAITDTGDLASWTPGMTEYRWNRCGDYRTVAVSQWRDWLLTIYLDKGNQTQLMPIANPASPPSVFKNTPTKSGWIKVAAGSTHALALTTDGHLVAWGDNTYGQLNLPTDITYRDAGDGFSLALSTDGTIYAAGKDDYGQVSGPKSFTGVAHIALAAGTDRAANSILSVNPCLVYSRPDSEILPMSRSARTMASHSRNLHQNSISLARSARGNRSCPGKHWPAG